MSSPPHLGLYATSAIIMLALGIAIGPQMGFRFNPFLMPNATSPQQVTDFSLELSAAAARAPKEREAFTALNTRLSKALEGIGEASEAHILLIPTTLPNREKLMLDPEILRDRFSREQRSADNGSPSLSAGFSQDAALGAPNRLEILFQKTLTDESGAFRDRSESYVELNIAYTRLKAIEAASTASRIVFAANPDSVEQAAIQIQRGIQGENLLLYAYNLSDEERHEALSFFSKPGALRPGAATARLKTHVEARERDIEQIAAAKRRLSLAVASGSRRLVADGGRQEADKRSRRQSLVARSAWESQRDYALSLLKQLAGFSPEAAVGPETIELEFSSGWKLGLEKLHEAGEAILAEHLVKIEADVERERLAALAMARDILNNPARVDEFNTWELVMLLQWMGGDKALPATDPSTATAFDAFDLYYSGQALSGPSLGYVLPRGANLISCSLNYSALRIDPNGQTVENSWFMRRPPEPRWKRSSRLSALVPEPKEFKPAFMVDQTGPSSDKIREAFAVLQMAADKLLGAAAKGT